MKPEKKSHKPEQKEDKKTLLGWFVSREEPDKDYVPDLKTQWGNMERIERTKFIMGAVIGAVIFIGALVLVYFILTAIAGWMGMG